jgi:sugar lactone lactonase YvrE
MRFKYPRNKALFALVLVMVSTPLLSGQATGKRPSPATTATAKQRLLETQPLSTLSRKKACEPGPEQTLIPPPGWFESVTTANNGDVYTSDQATMRIYRITPGNAVSVFASLFGDDYYDPQALYAGTLGLEFDRNGNLWVITLDYLNTERHGIYVVMPNGHSELAIPMDPNVIPVPNGLTFDAHGSLYVTESITGSIWKVARGEHVATLWLTHALLSPPPGGAFGANGIVYKDKSLFLANTDRGTLLRVPFNRDGSAGEPTVFAQLLDPFGATIGPDGVTIGPDKAVYATGAYGGLLVRIAENGTWEVLLDGLAYPTGAAFGKTHGERNTIYLANFLATLNNRPSVVKVDLCEP